MHIFVSSYVGVFWSFGFYHASGICSLPDLLAKTSGLRPLVKNLRFQSILHRFDWVALIQSGFCNLFELERREHIIQDKSKKSKHECFFSSVLD